MNKFWIEVMGFVAGIIIVRAYHLVSTGKISGEGLKYNILMAIGCAIYTTYSLILKAPAMMFVQAFFIIVATKALYRGFKNRNNAPK